ncbi:Crp/Fnr family transcriptional regulator [Clostridium senegalense]|uniref:Crp/Fnr family transcriptional regulator n=1 Tax=Clostridium senegalense TaxID=1465809 RepID=UPI001C125389|nr:Crp/Fnr family transcriptional regulator [Clostridium senegalense]MBU5227439.1 Crp/Fnr family transcriptional regulator [Clostridium senegalense]
MINFYAQVLKKSILFKNLSETEIVDLIKNLNYTIYDKCKNCFKCKSCVIALEGDPCTSLAVVLSGKVEIQKHYSNGKVVSLSTLYPGNAFGEAILFSKEHNYPSTVVAYKNTEIIYFSKEDVLLMCRLNQTILKNFMEVLSSKIIMLNKKVTILSLENLRQKICFFIMEEYKKQDTLKLSLNMSKKILSEHLGVQRPSLSRELINMKNEGIINFDRKFIEILNLEEIKYILGN